MSLFEGVQKKIEERRAARRPAFGIVELPGATPNAPRRTIQPEQYGLVKAAEIDDTLPGPNPYRERARELVAQGDWRGVAHLLRGLPLASDMRLSVIGSLGEFARKDDGWLHQWLAGDPSDTAALAVQINSMVGLAWEVRTAKMPQYVSREQWDGFFRVLRQIPQVLDRAVAVDPADPSPYLEMLTAARGLQWSHDEYRALWAEVWRRVPGSAVAVYRGYPFWEPKWFGSVPLLTSFVDDALAASPPGSTATASLLELHFDHLAPDSGPERTAYFKGPETTAAVDRALADAAAADPGHPRLPHLRHWLAFMLHLNGRDEASIEQFRLIGGYCGAAPWTDFKNPKAKFTEFRASTVLAWQDANAPAPA